MTKVVLGVADQALAAQLRSILREIDGVELGYVADTTTELVDITLRHQPDVVFVHDLLGPEQPLQVIRDLGLRRPGTASLLVTSAADAQAAMATMEAGGRGVVAYPLTFEEVTARLRSAAEWAAQMQRLVAGSGGRGAGASRAKVVAFVGAKGGVGTTTLATHLAFDVHRQLPHGRVCLVDLDLEKGDVSAMLEVRHSVSVADVAKVSEDISVETVTDVVVLHESGVHLLLAPVDVRDVEFVTPEAVRAIFALLRREYDLIVVDAGAHVTPAQAAIVELADDVVSVVTPDVLSMRSLRRSITAWEDLGVRDEAELLVAVNKVTKGALFPFTAVGRLTSATVLDTVVPESYRFLEPAVNSRDPRQVSETSWWKLIRSLGAELGVGAQLRQAEHPAADAGAGARGGARGGAGAARDSATGMGRASSRRAGAEAGQVALENIGIVPMVLLCCLFAWQVAVTGLTLMWSGNAADAAARELTLTDDTSRVRAAAASALPDAFQEGMTVSAAGDRVSVGLRIPIGTPAFAQFPTRLTSTREVVKEP